jgi:hypothetical protein
MINDPQSTNMAVQIRQLEERIRRLEAYQEYRKHFLSLNEGEVIIKSYGGAAQIVMKKNGDIVIKGNKVTITGQNDVFVKSSSEVILKGSKIGTN